MKPCPSARQRGVFTIFSTLASVAMLAFVGLVVDAGRMMLVRGELQGAADACALAAAAELNNSADGLASARAAQVGRQLIVDWSRRNFQSESIAHTDVSIRLSKNLVESGFSTTGTADARVVECRVAHPGLTPVLIQLAGVNSFAFEAVARAGLVTGGRVCALPLALSNVAYTLRATYPYSPYLLLAEHSGGALRDTASYVDQLAKWGNCSVTTAARIITLGTLPPAVAAALDARYANDPEVGTATGTTPRRVLAVPLVNSATGLTDRRWACVELMGGGQFRFLGYTHDGAAFVPLSTTKPWCIASGQPFGIQVVRNVPRPTGPFVAALLK